MISQRHIFYFQQCVSWMCLSRSCSCTRSLLSELLCRSLKKLCTSHLQKISNWTHFCSFQSNKTSSFTFRFERSRSIRNENKIKQMQSFNIHTCTVYRHVLYTVHVCIQTCNVYSHVLYTDMYCIQTCTVYRHVLCTHMYCIQTCNVYRHVLYTW